MQMAIVFSIISYIVFFLIAYWIIRLAVKHGVRDALKERQNK